MPIQISEQVVRKLVITHAEMPEGLGTIDPITVYTEDYGPGQGKITIEVFGEAWSHYWGAMGEQHTLQSFFSKASTDYLVGKLKIGIEQEITDLDPEALGKALKAEIIRQRKGDDLTHEQARDHWDDSDWVDESNYAEKFSDLIPDEWWYSLPKKPNPDYHYLTAIVLAVKTAFSMLSIARNLKEPHEHPESA